jgi:hypothetical protein
MLHLDEATLQDQLAASDAELSAYTLLEIARLRCERLILDGGVQAELRTIHREIGNAGYQLSTNFRPAARMRRLSLAYSQIESASDLGAQNPLESLFVHVIRACDAIAGALNLQASDHLHLAHLHVMSAAQDLNDKMANAVSRDA